MVGRFEANPAWLQAEPDHMASFGRFGATGVRRLAFTQEDNDARQYVIGLMEEAGADPG